MIHKSISKHKHAPGSIGELLPIALPMMASSACDTVMTFTNRFFLSKLGSAEMNAALAGGMMCFLMSTFFLGLIGYSTALIGQYYGSGQRRKCPVVVTQAIIIAIVAYPIILLLAPAARASFRAFGIAEEQLRPQTIYFNILIYCTILSLSRSALSCFFSGTGRTRIVMIASVVAMLTNVGINYVVVSGRFGIPGFGIRGAACGIIAGDILGLLVLVWAYFSHSDRAEYRIKESFVYSKEVMQKLLKLGYPAGLEFFLTLSAFTCLIMLFQSLGQVAATAATITFNWDMVAFVPLIGMEVAITSLVGRYMGARKPDTAHSVVMSGIKFGSIYSLIMVILFAAFPLALANIFRPDANDGVFSAALPLTLFMVRLMAFYVLGEAMIVAFVGALRGAGDTFFAMLMSVTLHWLVVGCLFVMFRVMHLSARVGWVSVIVWFMLLGFAFYLRYRSGKWREMRVVDSPGVGELEL
ncbi:MAG TPA: MATE family efflux transporter [Armatimonadota bacterium]|jgi:MATE family multidrug resistance protein